MSGIWDILLLMYVMLCSVSNWDSDPPIYKSNLMFYITILTTMLSHFGFLLLEAVLTFVIQLHLYVYKKALIQIFHISFLTRYIITFVNSQCKKTQGDFVHKNRFSSFVIKNSGIQK